MDSSNIDLNELWAGQNADKPVLKDLHNKMDGFKKNYRRKIIFTNLLLIPTCVFVIFIWVYFQPELITTKIGIVLVVLAMAMFILSTSKSLELFNKVDETEDTQHYLKNLLAIKEKQLYIQTTILNLYFVLLSLGIVLYLYEYALLMPTVWAVFTYGVSGLWILLNWFFIRPKQIKKQQQKLNDIIDKFKNIQSQLDKE
ncbi:hypothetical protein [Chondrinema litorale]|uniref:hypothetical protein n=1 Tax=Chondrinema litorale TaxID=2994555 RepID=UPI002542F9D2|nr:hypothetical protein [Chondrinema litorale]UZR98842.1 hypothetical protein OQ292_33155 [Chondrinema litorale]